MCKETGTQNQSDTSFEFMGFLSRVSQRKTSPDQHEWQVKKKFFEVKKEHLHEVGLRKTAMTTASAFLI
jgi:hypothetical protein